MLYQETGMPAELIKRVLKAQCVIISLDRPSLDDSGGGFEAVLPIAGVKN